ISTRPESSDGPERRQAGKPDLTRAARATRQLTFSILHFSFRIRYRKMKNGECKMTTFEDVRISQRKILQRSNASGTALQNQFPVGTRRQPFAFEWQIVVACGQPVVELIVVVRAAGMARFAAGIDGPQAAVRIRKIGNHPVTGARGGGIVGAQSGV